MSLLEARLFFRFFDSSLQSLDYRVADGASGIVHRLCTRLGLASLAPFSVSVSASTGSFDTVLIHGRLVGGKGGFGSMLRAQGGRMSKKKVTNFDSCRDLNGRRLRTVKQAKETAELMAKSGEIKRKREEEIESKIQSVLEGQSKKKYYKDTAYIQQSRELVDQVEAAVEQAFASDSDESESGSSQDETHSSDGDLRAKIDPLLNDLLSDNETTEKETSDQTTERERERRVMKNQANHDE